MGAKAAGVEANVLSPSETAQFIGKGKTFVNSSERTRPGEGRGVEF